MITIPQQVLDAEAIFVNHSGGKDSQAMLAALVAAGLKHKLVIVHADLGEMEWEPMRDWIESISFNLPVTVVHPKEDFFALCRRYKRLPSGQHRFCTSELKEKPCNDFIRQYCAQRGLTKVVSALGLRAQESDKRAAKAVIETSNMQIDAKRRSAGLIELTTWHPILHYKLEDVWGEIRRAGQSPHEIYRKGHTRLSCVVCVLGKVGEHKLAKDLRPDLFNKMASLERELGKTIRLRQVNKVKLPKYLDETFA